MPEVLEEIVDRLASSGWIAQPQEILRAAIQREELVSTALEHGLAFPHVRGVEGGGLVVAVGLSRKGVHFCPQERRLTRILFFSVIPQAASTLYLKIVGGLVRALRTDEARKKLLSCQESSEAWEVLLHLSGPTLP
jgi:mannitol/fructose-specific phosphotransferase system IIA component (Ntr-type)